MSVSLEELQAAENEAKAVIERMEKEDEAVREKYRDSGGLDPGAKEHREILDRGMKEIANIRKKYGIE